MLPAWTKEAEGMPRAASRAGSETGRRASRPERGGRPFSPGLSRSSAPGRSIFGRALQSTGADLNMLFKGAAPRRRRAVAGRDR